MADKIYIPPFKTQGIKTKLVSLIRDNARIDETTTWIEPFMGSGIVGLNVAPRHAIFADLNPHIINFYNCMKSGEITPETAAAFLRKEGAILSEKGGEHYYDIRERFNRGHCPLDFLFLNRSCFNGMIRFNKHNDFNVPYGHKPERFSKAYITKITNQVRHFDHMLKQNDWTFVNQPFEETIAMADNSSFIYCDPPYIGRHVDYFDSWEEAQEKQLFCCLEKSGAKYMLSTWDHNKYRENAYVKTLWNGCSKVTQEHYYHVGAREENRNPMVEALLMNYTVETAEPETVLQQPGFFAFAQ